MRGFRTELKTRWLAADRHDEAWEKEIDRIRTEIAESHRFNSFGAPREGNLAKWYIGTQPNDTAN